jgi:2,5-furandicarboxylate decarboxylase 1
MPKSLKPYLDSLRGRPEEMRVVSRKIDPVDFQVTALLKHLDMRKEFPGVLFENPLDMHHEPSQFPLVSNLWATRERCAEMLDLPREAAGRDFGKTFNRLIDTRYAPQVISSDEAPVQANVLRGEDVDMWRLPVVRHFEMDLSPVLTMALVMHLPGEQNYNVTFIKVFPENGQQGGVTIHGKDMARIVRAWKGRGEPIPVICVLGHHPAFWLGAIALTPYGANEYESIGSFLHEPVRLAPSVTWGDDFLVPADAEIVLEGYLHPDDKTIVDPFGEVSRLYQPQELAPLMKMHAMTHRDGAVFQDVFSGHREHFLLGSIPREGSIFSHLQSRFDGVTAVHLPMSGYGRALCYVSLKKTDSTQPKQVAISTLDRAGVQAVVIVDDDIDVFDEEEVIWAVLTYTDPGRDLDYIKNMGRVGDRAMGNNRIVIDATRPTDHAFFAKLQVPRAALDAMVLEDWLND